LGAGDAGQVSLITELGSQPSAAATSASPDAPSR
jgi:hypothetical protein